MKFNYPVSKIKSFDDFLALNRVGGFYPVGVSNIWHGGIHIEGDYDVNAIADGEVIAYRVPAETIELVEGGNPIKYSNGFVLMRHKYTYAKETKNLTFYSLYNHLATYDQLKSYGYSSLIKGLNARSVEDKSVKTVLPQGITLPISETPNADGAWIKAERNPKLWTKVKYTPYGEESKEYFLFNQGSRLKIEDNQCTILAEEDKADGILLYEDEALSKIKGVIYPSGDKKPEVDSSYKGTACKLKSGEFLKFSDFIEYILYTTPKDKLGGVVSCNCPLNSGSSIGYSWFCGNKKRKNYKAVHIEVFSGSKSEVEALCNDESWKKWEFSIVNESPDDFVFDCTDKNSFMLKVCQELDSDNKEGLTESEMQTALKKPEIARKLSRLVCYHNSEWKGKDVEDKFIEKVKKSLDDAIEKEVNENRKAALQALKEERIEELKERIGYGDFWDKVDDLKSFSSVYHFHPIAFVEQMKRMNCLCGRHFTVEEFKDLTTFLYEGKAREKIFTWGNCKLKQEDRTYERLVEELNRAFDKYEINTCNRKAHIIAQMWVETGRWETCRELAVGNQYELGKWEERLVQLQENIDSIKSLEPKIDAILKALGKTALDKSKPQIAALNAVLTDGVKLTATQQADVDAYKAIFDKQWKPQFDNRGLVKYNCLSAYEDAKEIASEKRIKNIKNMKNTEDGDGPRYKGKGLIQLTWRSTYEKYFTYLKTCNPVPEEVKDKTVEELLNRQSDDKAYLLETDLFYAADAAGWFWKYYKKISEASDYDGETKVFYTKSLSNIRTIEKITRMVKGGLDEDDFPIREKCYKMFREHVLCNNVDKIK